jgi:hypothetical protein
MRPFDICGAESRTQKMTAKDLKSLGSTSCWLCIFCRILQPMRNHFPWLASDNFLGKYPMPIKIF